MMSIDRVKSLKSRKYANLHLWTRANQSITKEVAATNEAGHGSYFLQYIGMRAPSLLSIYNIRLSSNKTQLNFTLCNYMTI